MTRSKRPTRAGTSNGNARVAARALSEPPRVSFDVYEDNVGRHHWRLVAASGETIAWSASFASRPQAEDAARIVHAAAGSASFDELADGAPPSDGDAPQGVDARRDGPVVRDDLDAERWLDEGGSFNGGLVTP